MWRASLVALIVSLGIGVAGCFQSDTVVFINPDGSGTVEETMLFSEDIAEMMESMAEDLGGEGEREDDPLTFEKAEGERKAATMGEGVTFVSSEKIEREGLVGFKAVYAFKDISKVKLDVEPDEPGPSMESDEEEEPEQMSFGFQILPSGNSLLTVRMPAGEGEPEEDAASESDEELMSDPEPTEEMGDEDLEMMKQMFDKMRFGVAVEVKGSLVETNSLFVEGERVTILEFDVSALWEHPEKLRELSSGKEPESLSEATEMLKDVPGIKVNPVEELTIEFAGR